MSAERPQNRFVIPVLTAVFLVVVMILIMNGGMCERYERRMQRQEMMRHYYDSVRRESQLERLKHQHQKKD